MAGLEVLPKNWRNKVVVCHALVAKQFKGWGKGKVWIDDNCPLQPSIVIVDEKLNVFRLTDPADTFLILRALGWSDVLLEIFSQQHLPELSASKTPPF